MNAHRSMLTVVRTRLSHLAELASTNLDLPDVPSFFLFLGGDIGNSGPDIQTISTNDVTAILSSISSSDMVAFIEPHLLKLFVGQCTSLLDELVSKRRSASILVGWKQPPAEVRRSDGEVGSFLCTGTTWKESQLNVQQPSGSLCYNFLKLIMSNEIMVDVLFIRQLPLKKNSSEHPSSGLDSTAVIIPHRHSLSFLQTTIDYVRRMKGIANVRSAIGLDVDDVNPYLHLKKLPKVDLYHCPSFVPAGPYVYRQALIETASEELIAFQDSDDVPCSDRLITLALCMAESDADMVGCHELEVNEVDRIVRAHRFPLDVSCVVNRQDVSGVSDNAAEPFLHATAMVKRRKFNLAGGFSTNRRIANDSQFFLRASLSMKIMNADAFLYVRRVHERALTLAPDTKNGNELRKGLSSAWARDFKRIKRGEIRVSQSLLVAQKAAPSLTIVKL